VRSRNETKGAQASLLEALAGALKEAELTEVQRRSLRQRVLAAASDCAPPQTETVRGASISWQQVPAWEGVWIQVLRRDESINLQVTVLRLAAGARVPGHAHAREEECLVLEGEVLIGSHRLRKGDFHLAHSGAHHPDITSPTGALLLVRSEIPSLGA
jgi:quercetin dioxygenase-like cupin family protein